MVVSTKNSTFFIGDAVGCFISSGALNRMYTLRTINPLPNSAFAVAHEDLFGDFYVCNLSTDLETARNLAMEYAEFFSIPFHDHGDPMLEKIQRVATTAAERAERDRIDAERREQLRIDTDVKFSGVKENGVFLVGKHCGKLISHVLRIDFDYVVYLLSHEVDLYAPSPYMMNIRLAHTFAEENPAFFNAGYVGVVGNEVTLTLTLNDCIYLPAKHSGDFSTYMFKCLDSEYRHIIFFSTAKKLLDLKNGQTFTVKVLIRKQEQRAKIQQTTIAKPKLLSVEPMPFIAESIDEDQPDEINA